MIRQLHIARALEKQVKCLHKAGKKAEWAVVQYEKLLELIRYEGLQAEAVLGKRTRNGECRINSCIKYDLGNGYRMVTVRVGNHLFVPFIGGHDETDQWLDRHRYDSFAAGDPAYMHETINPESCSDTGDGCLGQQGEEGCDDIYEEHLMERVDEALLKDIFQGLYQTKHAVD